MINLSYTVAGQLIEPASVPQYLVADTVGVYQVAFTFDSDWADMSEKKVVFLNPQVIDPDYRDVPVEFPLDANGQALVPAALLDPGKLFIGVYGTNSTQQFPTIWAPPLQVVPGASPGVEPSDDPALGTVIRTIPQTLTDEEKAQARENIGANEVEGGTPGNVVIIDNNNSIEDSGISKDNLILAPQLSSNIYAEDQTPYLYRQTGGGVDAGTREWDSIVGGSVVHHQIINPATMISRQALGVNLTLDGNGGFTVTGTPTATNNLYFVNGFTFKTHVYLFGAEGSTTNHGLMILSRKDTGGGALLKITTAQTGQIVYFFTAGEELNVSTEPYLYDITEMFGTAVSDRLYAMEQASAGAGLAVLNAMGLNQYRPYTAEPSLLSAMPTAHKMVGFNLFDKTKATENYYVRPTDNAMMSSSAFYCSDYIKVFPNTEYYTNADGTGAQYTIVQYDGAKNYIGYLNKTSATVFNTGSAEYIRLNSLKARTPIDALVCNRSDPVRNGTYEPYEEHTYPLDSSLTLRGVAILDDNNNIKFDGDEYAPDGTVTRRYGIITLNGSETNWNKSSSYQGSFYFNMRQAGFNYKGYGKVITPDLVAVSSISDYAVGKVYPESDSINFWLPNMESKTLAQFKEYVSEHPITVIYELSTPTVETATPYESLQICDPLGTEEYVDERSVPVPVGHVTKYPVDQVAKLDGLPSNFSRIIAPTEKDFQATQPYLINRLLIVKNVLYKTITAISNGATLTVGTNIRETTLDEVIASL